MAKKDKPPPSEEQQAAEQVATASLVEALHDYETYVQAQAENIWSMQPDDFEGLNMEEQLFVRSYIIDRDPVAALRRLGHRSADKSTLKARAARYFAKPEVENAIERLAKRMMSKLEITAERVNQNLAAVAFFDPREIMQFDQYGMQILNSRFWTEEQARAIQSIKQGQHGVEVKFYDRMRASEILGKQIGAIKDENVNAETARLAAEETMDRIAGIMGKLLPNAKKVIEARFEERKRLGGPTS